VWVRWEENQGGGEGRRGKKKEEKRVGKDVKDLSLKSGNEKKKGEEAKKEEKESAAAISSLSHLISPFLFRSTQQNGFCQSYNVYCHLQQCTATYSEVEPKRG
jgi:hypothetical protein